MGEGDGGSRTATSATDSSRSGSPFRWSKDAKQDLLGRVEASCNLLSLREAPTMLAERFVEQRFAESFLQGQAEQRAK
jgi:hypothetical protein